MTKFLILALFTFAFTCQSSTVFGAEKNKTTNSKMSQLGKIDSSTLDVEPTSKKEEIAEDTALLTGPEKVKVKFSCKAKDGHEIHQGQAGYEDCLQKVKNDRKDPKNPDADINVKFGN